MLSIRVNTNASSFPSSNVLASYPEEGACGGARVLIGLASYPEEGACGGAWVLIG